MLYIVYLDEFGHIGPFISKDHGKHNDSPIFGLAGFILPASEVRGFGTWFFNRKNELLSWEIGQSGRHPAEWEKKGAALYTAKNIKKYPELRKFTNRFLSKIGNIGGHVFYVGIEKQRSIEDHDSKAIYYRTLKETIKRVHDFCTKDKNRAEYIIIMDEHSYRQKLITKACQSMYGEIPMFSLIEPPFQAESNRYQTIQAADWIAALIGRIGAYWYAEDQYKEYAIIEYYFGTRIKQVERRSGIRSADRDRKMAEKRKPKPA